MKKINSIIKNTIHAGIFLVSAGHLWSCAAALCGYLTAAGFIAFLDDLRKS